MHIKYDTETRIVKRYGNICCITKAIWKKKSMDVQEINASKGIRYKGVYNGWMCGYGIVFDNEWSGRGYYTIEPHKQEWTLFETKYRKADPFEQYVIFDGAIPSDEEMELIFSVYPDFRYVYRKRHTDYSKQQIVRLLRVWQLHKQDVEFLITMDRYDLCFMKSIYTVKPNVKKRMCEILYKAKKIGVKNMTITELKGLAKGKMDIDLMLEWKEQTKGNISYELWNRCIRNKITNPEDIKYFVFHYNDYIRVAKEVGHNVNDDYWKYPKDLRQAHDKVMREKNLSAMKKRMEEAIKAKKVVDKYSKYNAVVDGYSIFITNDLEQWTNQASALSQCIIAMNYMGKMANRECLLFFIQKDGYPIATAQLYANKKLGQFYADESDRSNCMPSEEVKLVFNKWLENVKIGARI